MPKENGKIFIGFNYEVGVANVVCGRQGSLVSGQMNFCSTITRYMLSFVIERSMGVGNQPHLLSLMASYHASTEAFIFLRSNQLEHSSVCANGWHFLSHGSVEIKCQY